MKTCPITYEQFAGAGKYSQNGLNVLARNLKELKDLPYSAEEQRHEAVARASKISIQGVQPKLSARFSPARTSFILVDIHGQYILKPQSQLYRELPQNEDLTMRLAAIAGIDVPLHGLVYSSDASFTYFIKRFDRKGRIRKLAVEDFAQLSGRTRDTKYDSSMEQVAKIIEQYCTFPAMEKLKLFRLTLFNYLVGNEDMHLKNFSLLTQDGKTSLSPSYDLINTTIALPNPVEELALPLKGKKSKFTADIFLDYFGIQRLQLTPKVIDQVLTRLVDSIHEWQHLINISFLSPSLKERYLLLLKERRTILRL
jgi:serine/threonine-protein kinase HipA